MNIYEYNIGKDSADNNYSSLDHGVLKNLESCKLDEGYKCDLFTL